MTTVYMTSRQPFESPYADDAAAADAVARMMRERKLGSSDAFAASILGAFNAGRASKDQRGWLHILAMRTAAAAAGGDSVEAYDPQRAVDVQRLVELEQHAQLKGLKRFRVRGKNLVFYRGRKHLVAMAAGRVVAEVFSGATALMRRDAGPEIERELRLMARDPAAHARQYGANTGSCCFCGLLLTTPESVGNGYGPVCAENYGLPWATTLMAQRERDVRAALRTAEEIQKLEGGLA